MRHLRLAKIQPCIPQPKILSIVFAWEVKKLLAAYIPSLGLGKEDAEALIEKAGLEPSIRGEALPLEIYAKMADILSERV